MFRFHQEPPGAAVLEGGVAAGYEPRGIRLPLARPAFLFSVLSLFFGLLTAIVTPPLRGADEPAHFLRAYGLARGEIVPELRDGKGRKGILLPAALYDDFDFFQRTRYRIGTPGFDYRGVWADYARERAARGPGSAARAPVRAPVFVLYEGSEAYAPVAYLPYVAAAALARLVGLDFLGTLYLMRIFGLVAMTALAAYAIAVVPRLGWAFLLIAMLPTALYSRAVVSADGAVLGSTMLVAALGLAGASRVDAGRLRERALWMTLCILSKPPQIAFALLEAWRHPPRELRRRWRTIGLVVLPGLILSPLWIVAVGGDAAVWRMVESSGRPAEQFDPLWKLSYMAEHPLAFPRLLLATLIRDTGELWRAMIGVLGWGDTHLQGWVYPLLAFMLVAVSLSRLELERAVRLRIAAVGTLAMLAYVVALYLVFFLAWSPVDSGVIEGVQGRYFIVLLPVAAVVLAALVDRAPARATTMAIALAGALVSAAATLEAVCRFDWGL